MSRLLTLSTKIHSLTTTLSTHHTQTNTPQPSFSEDQPPIPSSPPPPDLLATQEALSEALEELYWLNQGPIGGVINKALASSVGLQFVLKGMGFGELAGRIRVEEKRVARLLRLAMTDHLFCEPEPGWVRHTSLTRALREVEGLRGWCVMYVEEMAPAVGKAVDAVAKWPESEEPNECGFNIANATRKPIFTFFSEDAPSRATRFKTAMAFHEHFPGLERSHVLTGFDWASLPHNATVVDIGGSHGGVSIELAKAFPKLNFVVQDLPDVIDEAGKDDVDGRVKFMAHDFFTEQPVKDADVYFMRFILHNWSDKYCVQILQALVPALKPGARILLNEQSLQPSSAVPPRYERWQRAADINMMAVFNSQERDETEWVELFRKASPRFELEEVRRTEGALLDMIVFTWK
ncbi:hypothetical protein M409DRAFT_66047 [Zasmidium cellare ATCC 36951]|uniref:O-methyltransferase C-terminal domain-containing protein n=1 Tax=Zasmidium cellare ATCC 36951 TaxID=1080233 RepID=A0A6A6CP17_ZASCE|nr:uncharacterized protein M409DRAFT_66047 [Zasmidium cellare ATCC 36951]KAF2167489.1 hypothetical protein M409DRAFT_66047 [Zasmidium cellare ATCC 36951]